jgi:hypothetical protein
VSIQEFPSQKLQKKNRKYTLHGKCTNFPLLIATVKVGSFLDMMITEARNQ